MYLSSLFSKKLTFILLFSILCITVVYFFYISRDAWLIRFTNINQPSNPNTKINSNIEKEEYSFPAHVQSGIVAIGKNGDQSTYKFGKLGDPSKYLDSQGYLAQGIFIQRGDRWEHISTLEELNNGDFITITYYRSPSYSDSGKRGETILGIVNKVEEKNDVIELGFLDDPRGSIYRIVKNTTSLEKDDHLGVFEFGDSLFDSIERGGTLRILVDNNNSVISTTVLAPRGDLAEGRLKKIVQNESEDEYQIFIGNINSPFFITNKTKILERYKFSKLTKASDIPLDSYIILLYYNKINRNEILSLDFSL